jgi:hypothetical protein
MSAGNSAGELGCPVADGFPHRDPARQQSACCYRRIDVTAGHRPEHAGQRQRHQPERQCGCHDACGDAAAVEAEAEHQSGDPAAEADEQRGAEKLGTEFPLHNPPTTGAITSTGTGRSCEIRQSDATADHARCRGQYL